MRNQIEEMQSRVAMKENRLGGEGWLLQLDNEDRMVKESQDFQL